MSFSVHNVRRRGDQNEKIQKLRDQVRESLRFCHYSYSTKKNCIQWILRYIRFNNRRYPKNMGKPEIEMFLSRLAINNNIASATRNRMLIVILFLYKLVLKTPIDADFRANYPARHKRSRNALASATTVAM